MFLVGVCWRSLWELLPEQRVLPWQVRSEKGFKGCSAQQLIQNAQCKESLYWCYWKRPLSEPLNWSWDWDEGSCWVHWEAEILELEAVKLLHDPTSVIPVLAIGIHCQAKMRHWHCHWPCWISGLKQGMAVLDMGLKACCANPCDKMVISKLSSSWYRGTLQMSVRVSCTVLEIEGLCRWVGYFSCMCIFDGLLEAGEGNVAHSNRCIMHDWIFRQSYVSGFWFSSLIAERWCNNTSMCLLQLAV